MKVWQQYLEEEINALRRIERTQPTAIEQAARILADCTKNDGIIRVFGCGHSHLIADDVFYRSATLGNVQAVLEEAVTGNTQITKSGFLEKMEGYAEKIIDYYRFEPNDAVICISNSGNNAVTLEFAKICKERGFPVIVLPLAMPRWRLSTNISTACAICKFDLRQIFESDQKTTIVGSAGQGYNRIRKQNQDHRPERKDHEESIESCWRCRCGGSRALRL